MTEPQRGKSYWSQRPPERTEASGRSMVLIVGIIVVIFVVLPVLAIVALIFLGSEISSILSQQGADFSNAP